MNSLSLSLSFYTSFSSTNFPFTNCLLINFILFSTFSIQQFGESHFTGKWIYGFQPCDDQDNPDGDYIEKTCKEYTPRKLLAIPILRQHVENELKHRKTTIVADDLAKLQQWTRSRRAELKENASNDSISETINKLGE